MLEKLTLEQWEQLHRKLYYSTGWTVDPANRFVDRPFARWLLTIPPRDLAAAIAEVAKSE